MEDSSSAFEELKHRLVKAEARASAAEAALREGDTRHRLLIESWAQAMWETDATGVVVADSPTWRAYTGQTLEEWLGYGWLDAIHPDDRAYAERQWREAMAARRRVNAEFRLRAPDGGWRWTNVLAAPMLDAAGSIEKWLGLNIDIDDRKQAEASLRESEERYRSLFESMDEAYAVVEVLKDENGRWADFRFLEVNRAFLVHTTMPWPVGKTATELLGSPNPRWTELYGQALDTGETLRVEEPEATLGIIFDLNIFSLDRDRNRVAVLFTNITDRKCAELALRESEARYRNLFETMRQGYVENELIRDADGRAVDYRTMVVNPQFERLTGTPAGEALGRTARDIVGELDPVWVETYERVVRTGKPEQFEREEPAFERWFEVQAYPLTGDRFAILYDDITERRRTNAALRESEERQAFLLELADALRPQTEAADIQRTAASLLGDHLEVGRAYYAEMDEARGDARVRWNHLRGNSPSLVGVHRLADYGWVAPLLRKGEPVVVVDAECTPQIPESDRQAMADMRIAAAVYAPLIKNGKLVGALSVTDTEPRTWSNAQVSLVEEVAERTWEAVERARTETALRESEERQAFLLKLADALRPLSDPVGVQQVVVRMLAGQLDVDRCYYAEFDWPRDVLTINTEFVRSPSFTVIGEHPISAFQDLLQFSHTGEPLVCDNIATHPIFKTEMAAYRERGTDGFILIPQIKQGLMAACICVTMTTPRTWTPAEVELVREVGDRTWDASQRARTEAALRESEERFQQFAEASSGAIWIRDAATLKMEFVNSAIERIYGVAPDKFLNGVQVWASSIVPDDREIALQHIERARLGEAVVHEFRIQRGDDQSFRWIRDTDFPLYDSEGRIERIGGIAEDVTEAKLSAEHQKVLLAELQHRVRNIMGMIRSMTNRTAKGALTPEDYRLALEGRLLALARVQALLTRNANAGGSLRQIIEDEVTAQAHHTNQFELTGPEITLPPKAVEVLTLAFHELATNALKYGAFSVPEGRLNVSWAPIEKRGTAWLELDWVEEGARVRPPSTRRGFGSELIEARIPYELGGSGRVTIEPAGARCHFEFPLREGESILETDAPMPTTTYGGTLDMTGAPDLTGRSVLVVEDDYYMAADTAAALRGAGAEVLGPCPTVDAARELLETDTPTHAVLDLNLGGGGPKFDIAHLLKSRGVPFVFLTGYDSDVIPPELADVVRLQKPIPFRSIIEAVSQL